MHLSGRRMTLYRYLLLQEDLSYLFCLFFFVLREGKTSRRHIFKKMLSLCNFVLYNDHLCVSLKGNPRCSLDLRCPSEGTAECEGLVGVRHCKALKQYVVTNIFQTIAKVNKLESNRSLLANHELNVIVRLTICHNQQRSSTSKGKYFFPINNTKLRALSPPSRLSNHQTKKSIVMP